MVSVMVGFHCTLTTFSVVALSHFSDAGKRFDWVPAVLCSLTFHRLISLLLSVSLFPSSPPLYLTLCAPSLFSSPHLLPSYPSPLFPSGPSQAATSLMMKSLLHWRSLRSQKSWQRVGWPICWTVMYVTYHCKSFPLT